MDDVDSDVVMDVAMFLWAKANSMKWIVQIAMRLWTHLFFIAVGFNQLFPGNEMDGAKSIWLNLSLFIHCRWFQPTGFKVMGARL